MSSVTDVAKSQILGNATFVDEPLSIEPVPVRDRARWREDWFQRVKQQVTGCDLVLADPDNGLVPDEMFKPTEKVSAKRLPLHEVAGLVAPGRTLIVYHHSGRNRPHRDEIRWWMSQLSGCAHAFYWKRWSCRTFFIINPDREIENRLTNFAHRWRAYGDLILGASPDKSLRTELYRNLRKLEQRQELLDQSDMSAATVGAEHLFTKDLRAALHKALLNGCGTSTARGTPGRAILDAAFTNPKRNIDLGFLLGLYDQTARSGLHGIRRIRNAFAHISSHRPPRFQDQTLKKHWANLPFGPPSRENFLESIDEFRRLLKLDGLNYERLVRLRRACCYPSDDDLPSVQCVAPSDGVIPPTYQIHTPYEGPIAPEGELDHGECYQLIRCFNGQSPDAVKKLLQEAEHRLGRRLPLPTPETAVSTTPTP
ncbi:MAG: hypothetical protein OXF33_12335 [Rhodospirillales bacterium]|nr:hypothetical protein [Rhodospirillales bacterium]